MSEPLKPCPVCGGEASLEEWQEEADNDEVVLTADEMVDQFQVICGFCDAEPPGPCNDPDEAVRRWNRWAGEPQPR